MREKKHLVVITFHTTSAAMAMEKLCQKQGLPGRLIPAPRAITSDCGIAWSAPWDDREKLENLPGMPEVEGIHEIWL
jgi:hypothetical protein